ncbi:MAG TPA: YbaK/EbsC family protein [Microlunatus sp.]|nr:YbaK/EbsC family protein [Microlunatus sp.]
MTVPDLGSLTWLPAADRPDLLATPVSAALDGLDAVRPYVAEIDGALADTAAFCAAYAVELEQSANCVVVAGRRGDTTTVAACLVLATDRADVNKTVRKHLGLRKISFAAMDDAVSQTSMEFGGITAIGLPDGWPVLVDAAVIAQPWLVIGSGLRRSKIAVRGADVASLPGVEVLELAVRPS